MIFKHNFVLVWVEGGRILCAENFCISVLRDFLAVGFKTNEKKLQNPMAEKPLGIGVFGTKEIGSHVEVSKKVNLNLITHSFPK